MMHTSHILVDYKNQTIEVRLSMRVYKDDDYFFAECPEMQMMDQGKYPREAAENLMAMIQASLIESILTNNIDKMMYHLNFKKKVISERKYFNQSVEADDELLPLNLDSPIPANRELMAAI